jgi:glutathione S-transferase
MLTLYQAEWCPHSRRVRRRLTQLMVDVHVRQVAPWPEDRDELRALGGDDSIPQLVTEEHEVLKGDDAILAYLDDRYDEPPEAEGHREQERAHAGARSG